MNFEELFIKYNGERLKKELEVGTSKPFIGGRKSKKIIGVIKYIILNKSIKIQDLIQIISKINDKFFSIIESDNKIGELYDFNLYSLNIYFDNYKFNLNQIYNLIMFINEEHKSNVKCLGIFHYCDVIIGNIGCSSRIKQTLFSSGISFLELLVYHFRNTDHNLILSQELKEKCDNDASFIEIEKLYEIGIGEKKVFSIN